MPELTYDQTQVDYATAPKASAGTAHPGKEVRHDHHEDHQGPASLRRLLADHR
ncbi:hypothetical protein N8H71_03535 [Pseudomonas koreensis]|uniref:hypothetical protein n=1 Tax=Pseudomonas koreensis TaxID=198620 RepID=UPI0021C9A35F|nr:hypothetical protein [Pseudomonas koreensis]MCU0070643.1 hypothetical protein [Pseudomonas koreensis]